MSFFVTQMNCHFILQLCETGIMSNTSFHLSVPICQSCCSMTNFRPNPVTGFSEFFMCGGLSVDLSVCTAGLGLLS